MPRFELVEGSSSKFWEISIRDASLTIRFGKIGTDGTQNYKVFDSTAEAQKEYDKLIAQKMKKGYTKVSDDASAPAGGNGNGNDKTSMSKQEFWALIDQSKRGTEDTEEQLEKLREMLGRLTAEEIVKFDFHLNEAKRDAYRWDLWGAAYIINGGCSDDGFEYFIGWLIAQGQKYFEASLADPNHAGSKVEPGDFVECEEIMYVPIEAYESVTGKDDWDARQIPVACELQGEQWEEDQVDKLFPKLAKKFNS